MTPPSAVQLVEFLAFVASVVGTVLVIRRDRWGYVGWLAGNVLWMVYAGLTGAAWLFLTQIVFAGLSVYGFVRWSKGGA